MSAHIQGEREEREREGGSERREGGSERERGRGREREGEQVREGGRESGDELKGTHSQAELCPALGRVKSRSCKLVSLLGPVRCHVLSGRYFVRRTGRIIAISHYSCHIFGRSCQGCVCVCMYVRVCVCVWINYPVYYRGSRSMSTVQNDLFPLRGSVSRVCRQHFLSLLFEM